MLETFTITNGDEAFDTAEALYYICNHYHTGGGSFLYQLQCKLTGEMGYQASPVATGPSEGTAHELYCALANLFDASNNTEGEGWAQNLYNKRVAYAQENGD